jgi:high-affinity nickel-transport protein
MANFNINKAGFAIAALFVIVWLVAITYWKIANVEHRWAGVSPADSAPGVGGA